MEKIKENNTNDPGTRSSIDNQSALKNNEVYQAISDIKDFYNDILSIISKDEDPDTPRFIIQNGVINRVQQDPRGYFEYLAYNMLRSEDALIKQIIYRYCIDNNRKDGINNLIHSDSDAPSTTNEVAIYDLSHLLQSWYATILNDCNGELQELSQPNIMNEFDICTNNKNKIDIDDADSSNKSPTSSLFIRRTGTNLSVQIKNNNKTPPLIDSSLSVLKSGSHSLEASPMVMSGEIGDLGSARKELDSRGHVWLDAKPASGLASIQAADKVGDNALRDRSNSKSYVYTNSSPDSSPDSYKSGTTYSSNVEKVTKSFGDGMELDSNSNNSDVESISTVPSTDVATDTVSNNITESKESVSSAVPMEPKLLISPFSNYCYQTFNFLPDVIRKQLNDSEEETRAEGQTGRTTATVPQKSETEVPSLTRSTESSMYNILANLSRSNSGKKSNGTFIDEDCDLGLGMEFDGSLVINEHIFDIGSLRQVEEGNDDHIDPRDDTVDGVSPRRKPGTLAHSSLADYYNSASKEKQQIRRGQENMFFSGDDGHVPTDLIPMDSNSLTIITDEPVVKKSGIKESDSVNKHTPVPTANSSSVVTPSISPAPSVQRRKRRKYMEISEMNKNGIMINKQIVAPKGIYRTPHGFRVQLNIENMKNITGNSNVMKGKFSRNSKTFEDVSHL